MAKRIQRLTALAVTHASKPGLHADGAGLYLRVGRGGAKAWALRFMINGNAREMGLGALTKVSLADARKKAIDALRRTSHRSCPRRPVDRQAAMTERMPMAYRICVTRKSGLRETELEIYRGELPKTGDEIDVLLRSGRIKARVGSPVMQASKEGGSNVNAVVQVHADEI
jgi:hypothetical protein